MLTLNLERSTEQHSTTKHCLNTTRTSAGDSHAPKATFAPKAVQNLGSMGKGRSEARRPLPLLPMHQESKIAFTLCERIGCHQAKVKLARSAAKKVGLSCSVPCFQVGAPDAQLTPKLRRCSLKPVTILPSALQNKFLQAHAELPVHGSAESRRPLAGPPNQCRRVQ